MLKPVLTQIPAHVAALADYEPLACERMSDAAWAYVNGAAADELTLRGNRAAFDRIELYNRVLSDLAGAHTRSALFGQQLAYPILLAPVAHQRLAHPDAELASALAAAAMNACMVVSTEADTPLEDIARAPQSQLWFQLYFQQDRGLLRELLARVEAAGYRALVLTVDAPVSGLRNREQRVGPLPAQCLSTPNRPDLPPGLGTVAPGGSLLDSALLAQAPTWRDVEWLRTQTRLPLLLKGITHPDDALTALTAGVDGIVVSNHGGRVLDTQIATIDALPAITNAVAGRVPVLCDGGIRRGTDVFKALALGASAVLIGRPYVHALAAAGASGVAHVLHLLRMELEQTMILCGCRTLADIGPDRLVRYSR